MPKPKTPTEAALTSRDLRRRRDAARDALDEVRKPRRSRAKVDTTAKVESFADETVVPARKGGAGTGRQDVPAGDQPKVKPPRPRRIQLGAAVVTSADVFDVRSQKLHQQLEVAVAGTVVTIDVTPAGKKATVLVNGVKA